MTIEKYQFFGPEDFLEDEYFQKWIFNSDLATETFWQQFLEAYPDQNNNLLEAKKLLHTLYGYFENSIKAVSASQAEVSFRKLNDKIRTSKVKPDNKIFRLWSIAAFVIILITAGSLFWIQNANSPLTYTTGYGQRLSLFLPDSTSIELNANSKLSYNKRNWMKHDKREVWLEGEGFFEVAKKADGTKFTVHLGELSVNVLGTQFNVKERGEKSEIVLSEGKVELDIKGQKIEMHPGDYIGYSNIEQKVESRQVTATDFFAWKDGITVFNNTLSEVAKEIEILYGVIIKIDNQKLKSRHIQLSAPANNIDQVLEILELMYSSEIKIKSEDDQIIIY